MVSNHQRRHLATSVLGDVAAGRRRPAALAGLLRSWSDGGLAVGVLETPWCAVLFTVLLLGWAAAGVTAGAYLAGVPGELAGLGVAGVVMSAPLFALFTDNPRINLVILLTASVPVTLLAGVAAAWWVALAAPRRSDVLISSAQARANGVSLWWPRPLRFRDGSTAAAGAAAALAAMLAAAGDAADWLAADAVHAKGVAARTMETTAADLRAAAASAARTAAGGLAADLSGTVLRDAIADGGQARAAVRFPPLGSDGEWEWCPVCGCDHREDAKAGRDATAGTCGCVGHYGHGPADRITPGGG